ncbi:MAG: hypothetical protein ACM3O8_14120 [Methylococcaceae bacterium]|nr:hypothetical protein [Prolixibacteraceae bacterium]
MTLLRQSSDTSFTGMIGGVVICHRNGKVYLRRAPQYSKSSWTKNQKVHRTRFKEVNQFCKQFKKTLIQQIWKYADPRTSGHSLFLKANMGAFSLDGQSVDPLKVQVSTGVLELEQGMQVSRQAGQSIGFTVLWQKSNGGGIRWWDELMVVSMAGGIYSDIYPTGLLRGKLGGDFVLPALPEDTSHLYLFFASKDRRSYSPSLCFALNADSAD